MAEQNYWQRMRRRRMSRRAILGASARAGVGAAGLALVGCGDDDDDDGAVAQVEQPQAQQQAQTQGQAQAQGQGQAVSNVPEGLPGSTGLLPGELTAEEDAAGLNPEQEFRLRYHWSKLQNLPGQANGPKYGGEWIRTGLAPANWNVLGPNASLMAAYAPLFYSSLVVFKESDYDNAHFLINEGQLATGWELADDVTLVFQLREGINWQDDAPLNGRPMTAEDVKLGYDALREAPVQASSYTAVSNIEASEGDRTVRFNLSEPAAYLINNMTNPFHVVVAPEFHGDSILDVPEGQVGTGPFLLGTVDPGIGWDATKNPNYWWTDPRTDMEIPFIDSIKSLVFTGAREAEFTAWQTGEIDQIVSGDLVDLERVQELQPNAVTQVTAPPPGWQPYTTFKDLTAEPFNDPRVRQALSAGQDRPEQKEGIFNGVASAGYGQNWTFFRDDNTPWGFREWPWTEEELGNFAVFQPDVARQLLDAAGYTDDNPLSFKIAMYTIPGAPLNLFLLMLDQWQRNLPVEPEHEQIDVESWVSQLFIREYSEALFTYLVGSEMDADGLSYGRMHSESPGNVYGINDPEIDEWSQAQRQELDVDKRSELLEKIRLKDLENMWRIFNVNPYRIMTRREHVYNHADSFNAWNPGWGVRNTEHIWLDI